MIVETFTRIRLTKDVKIQGVVYQAGTEFNAFWSASGPRARLEFGFGSWFYFNPDEFEIVQDVLGLRKGEGSEDGKNQNG